MSELKPCPFCGGEARLENLSLLSDKAFWSVRCKAGCAFTRCDSSKERVIKKWNRRMTDEVQEADCAGHH